MTLSEERRKFEMEMKKKEESAAIILATLFLVLCFPAGLLYVLFEPHLTKEARRKLLWTWGLIWGFAVLVAFLLT